MAKKLFKSFGYKAIQIIVFTLYSILLIPILLTYWDLQVYGAWIALYTIFNLVQVIEFGHATYVGNQFNQIAIDEPKNAKILLGSALRANIITGLLQMLVVFALFVSGLLKVFLDTEISDYNVAIVLTILFLYRMLIGSFRGVIVKVLNPFGIIYKAFQFSLYEKILEFFILVIAAVTSISLIELAILWFSVKFVFSLMVLWKLKGLLPEYFPWWKYGSFKIGINNLKKSVPFAASNFLDRLGNDGVVLVVSAFVGSTFLPLFTATRTIVNFGLKLSDFFLNPITPEIINLYVKGKLDKIKDIFRSFWFTTGVVLMSGFTVSLLFIEELFTIWTNGKLDFNIALYSSLVIIFLVQNYGKMVVTFFTGINKTKIVLFTSIIRVSLFFLIAFLCRDYGLYGVLLGMFGSELLVASLWLPHYSFKTFSIEGTGKVTYMLNLFTVLFLAVIFYLNYLQSPIWVMVIVILPIVALLYYQYTLISPETRMLVSKSFSKLTTFAKKKQ